jgi:hypothetical protein
MEKLKTFYKIASLTGIIKATIENVVALKD